MVGTWYFRQLEWYQAGPMYYASNALAPHELRISRGSKIVALIAGGAHGFLFKSCVTSNTWYAKSFGWTSDVQRRLS